MFVYEMKEEKVMPLREWVAKHVKDSHTININNSQFVNVGMYDGPNGSICTLCIENGNEHKGILLSKMFEL